MHQLPRLALSYAAPLRPPPLPSLALPRKPETTRLRNVDLSRAIAQLPIAYRQVIQLADLEGLSDKEVADHLQIPLGTVTSSLTRARSLLRRYCFQPKRVK